MDEKELVRTLLARAADEGGHFAPPPVADLQRVPRRSPRTMIGVAASVVVVAALAIALANDSTRQQRSTPPSRLSQSPAVSAEALAHYTWKRLPAAPIDGRVYPAAVWTGKEMIVWGGLSGYSPRSVPEADGAAYDPATRVWRKLPPAPLSARWEPAAAWAAGKFVVWSGVTSPGKWSTNGATYDPETGRWQRMAPAPVQVLSNAHAFTIGKRMVVLSTPSELQSSVVHADAYDPDSDTWTALPDLKLPADQQTQDIVGLVANGRLLVWTYWVRTLSQTAHGYSGVPGQTAWTLDPGTGVWRAGIENRSVRHIQAVFWTGSRILIPRQDVWCGPCLHPGSERADGIVIDPGTGTSTAIPEGPLSLAQNAPYLWTGAALLQLDNHSSAGTATEATVRPGDTAAWDPDTEHWTRVPRAPFVTGGNGVVIWTGHSAIVWGIPYNAKAGHQAAVGIELAR